jgi:hypothetical protein
MDRETSPILQAIRAHSIISYWIRDLRNPAARNPSDRLFVSFVPFDAFDLKNEVNEVNKGKQELSQQVVPNGISTTASAETYS